MVESEGRGGEEKRKKIGLKQVPLLLAAVILILPLALVLRVGIRLITGLVMSVILLFVITSSNAANKDTQDNQPITPVEIPQFQQIQRPPPNYSLYDYLNNPNRSSTQLPKAFDYLTESRNYELYQYLKNVTRSSNPSRILDSYTLTQYQEVLEFMESRNYGLYDYLNNPNRSSTQLPKAFDYPIFIPYGNGTSR